MAYLQQDDEDQQQGQGLNQALTQPQAAPQQDTAQSQEPQAPQQSSAPTMIGQGSQPTQNQQSTQASPAPTQVNQKAGSGMFTNLKKYLEANRGNRISSAATQKVAHLGAGAQKGIQTAQTGFGQRVEQGTLKNRQQAVQDVTATTQAARQVQAQQPAEGQQPPQYIQQEQAQRFADVINAQYQGPESLRQAGLLEPAAKRVSEAARQMQNTRTAQGREELLRSMFGKNREYTQGQSKLDALLLNTSQQGVQNLQQAAQQGQGLTQRLQQAENESQNLARNRAQEIRNIREQARNVFQTGRTEEEQATEQRISDLIETPAKDESGNPIPKLDAKGQQVKDANGNPVYLTEWERLPEHFRQSLMNKGQTNEKVKQEQLAALNQQYAPQIKAASDAAARVKNLEAQFRDTQKRLGQFASSLFFEGTGYTQLGAEGEKRRDELLAQSNVLQQQINQAKADSANLQKSPEYQQYRQALEQANKMNMNQWILSPEEAAILGVSSGEGLYNIRPEDIRTTQADRERLITQNEFARQQALAQLAGLDTANALQKELKYKDQTKAGTQDLMSSLDTESFRRLLDESQQGFEEAATAANLTGVGKKKVSRGNIFGKKTKTYHAQQQGNVADMLRSAGYDVNTQTPEGARSLLSDRDMLNRYLGATDTQRAEEGNVGFSGLEGTAAGAGTGATIGSAIPGVGTAIGAAIGAGIGGAAGTNSLDVFQTQSDMLKEMEEKLGIRGLGAVGQAIQDARSKAGDLTGTALQVNPFTNIADDIGKKLGLGSLSSGIAGAVGGINTGAMKAYGSAIAKDLAIKDLKSKYANWLKGQGFENRANIADTQTTQARAAALRELLNRKG